MKRITLGLVLAALMAALVSAPVQAQGHKQPKEDNALKERDEQRQKENAVLDKQYQKTLKETNGGVTAPVKIDPWANMRGTDASKR